ncbi:P-loop containing nucleoside triphosphate hydrolase protein [Peziza echinospora]|nr:P-loop containing nucleoside triphosphate hydrolase protein [Peziza echinospora]
MANIEDKISPAELQHSISPGLKWDNLSLAVVSGRGKKAVENKILQNVSGYANRGEMTAIMGPSGAGKTTLANVLTGRVGGQNYQLGGKVTFEGEKRQENIWKSITAYVEQEDLMYDCLTVEETIIFSAMLRLPSSTYTKAQKIARARQIIEILGLSKVKDSRVGSSIRRGISGGERKRCAVGVELVTSPKLMFLDEPTSGLDSHSAYNVVSTVKDVAKQGVAVLVTIHQPAYELFQMFDKVILIAQGRIAYHGSILNAVEYFASLGYPVPQGANAADHFISLLTPSASSADEKVRGRVDEILDAWEKASEESIAHNDSRLLEKAKGASEPLDNGPTTSNGFALGYFEELWWLFRRGWTQALRDKQKIIANFMSAIFVGLILSFTFYRLGNDQGAVIGRAGLLFFIPVNISFGVLFPIISYLPLLNGILVRERSTGAYRVSTFYISRYLIEIPMAISSRMIFFLMVYWICGFKQEAGAFFIFLGMNCLTVVYSISMGLFIGSTSRNLAVVQAATPALNVIFLLFGGFLLPLASIPDWFIWLHWISYLTFNFAATTITEFQGRVFDCPEGAVACYKTGEDFLKAYDLTTFTVGGNAGLLAALTAIFAVSGYFMLRRLTNPRLRLDI